MIEIKNVSKKFKETILFDDVSMDIPSGVKMLIKGENGTGKSVFLKLIVGYSKIDCGDIVVDGLKIGKDRDFIQDAGVSINAPEFCNDMTGLENLLYLAKIKNIATKKEIISLCDSLNLTKFLNKKYKTYSLGMKQKMRIVQALMDKPKYLILDEPFDALDYESQKKLVDVLNKYMDKTKTIIFTSHNKDYENFADIVYEISDLKLKKI